jgi:hypothetical protein
MVQERGRSIKIRSEHCQITPQKPKEFSLKKAQETQKHKRVEPAGIGFCAFL